MQEESPDEFLIGEGGLLQLGFIPVILPQEAGHPVPDREDAVVADHQAVGVPSQVLEHPLGPAKRFLGVHDPVLLEATIDKG